MLRRKLLVRVGLLITAFVIGAGGAIWGLQRVLEDVDHANADAAYLIDGILSVGSAVNAVEAAGFTGSPASVADHGSLGEQLSTAIDRLGRHPVTAKGGPAEKEYTRVREALPRFLAAWTSREHVTAGPLSEETVGAGLEMQAGVQELARALRSHVASAQSKAGSNFRSVVLALTVGALLMVNVAALTLLHTARMILRPVSALLNGSRELAAERFEHRVVVPENDEFGELAHAYNSLARQLQASEERKAEALRHLAVTINHELNNAMAIIELQLALLDRQAGAHPDQSSRLRDIRATLARMSSLVSSLKNIRRVVLADYAPGQKMLDLARSVDEGRSIDSSKQARPS